MEGEGGRIMEEGLFAERWRVDTARLPGWDYGSSGYYFITICTKERAEYFGDVLMDDGEEYSVALTDVGKIARDELLKTPDMRPQVKLDAWVIMPNHIHAIIEIRNTPNNEPRRDALHASLNNENASQKNPHHSRDARGGVDGDARGASLQGYKNTFGPQRNNLASIVRGFKSAVQSRVKCDITKLWQPRFYDRIIHNERALWGIRQYIQTNPERWHRNRNNPRLIGGQAENIWI